MSFNKGKAYGRRNNADWSESHTEACLVLGLGVEKALCKKFSARLEGDYNCGGKKGSVKFNKGFTIRALAAYNIKY